jgi:hypothetical protein
MSYVLADSTGPLEEFASIGGLADFTAWAREMPEPLPSFVRDGYTEDIEQLSSVLADSDDPPPSVIEQLDALRTAAAEAEDILIISNGMSDEDLTTLGDNPGHEFHGNQWTNAEPPRGEAGSPERFRHIAWEHGKTWREKSEKLKKIKQMPLSAVNWGRDWEADTRIRTVRDAENEIEHFKEREQEALRKIRTLGGPGSGNFGHAGRPGEVGGSGGLKVYHGTSEEALRAIRKEGLVPHGSKGGDAWAISIGRGSPDDFLSQTEVNGRRASVFVAEHKETAESFAEYATRMHPGSEAAVIEITIPESEVGRIKEDELSLEKRFEGRIPPTWITKAEVFHPTPERRHDPKYPIADQDSSYKIFGYDTVADTHKLYFVLLMDGQPATLGGAGSGNFGHSGRPGEVGGSGGGAGGSLDLPTRVLVSSISAMPHEDRERLTRNIEQVRRSATQAGVPLNKVKILDEHNTFVQGGQQFEELGHYSAKDDEIVFNARPLAAETTQSTEIAFAHENTHREWKEFSDLVGLKSGDPNAASSEARAAVYTLMDDRAQLAKDDGITPYSRAYWRDYQRDLKDANELSLDPDVNKLHTDQANHSFLRATNETLAEISANELKRAFGQAPGSVGSTKSYDPTPIWRTLHKNIKAAVKNRG